jgi:hypothetical protein
VHDLLELLLLAAAAEPLALEDRLSWLLLEHLPAIQ